MIGRAVWVALLLSASLGAAERWQLPRQVFPHEVAVAGENVFVASTAGLWRLNAEGKVKRIGPAKRAAWPITGPENRLWWLQDAQVVELDAITREVRPVRSLETKRVGVVSQRHGVYFVDDESGLMWSRDGETWHGPVQEAQHGAAIDRLGAEWWAITNPASADANKFVLSRSVDLQTWTQAAEFLSVQPGSLAAGSGVILVSEVGGVRVFDPREPVRPVFVSVGPDDERPAVYFEHSCFWVQGERDGLWRSADGRNWQNLAASLKLLGAPLVQIGFARDALVLAGYTGRVVRVPLSALPPISQHLP